MRFLLIHPSADPDVITRAMGLVPLRAWRRGEPRFSPKGTRLEGVWRDTRWIHVFELDRDATVERAVAAALDTLSPASRFLTTLRETGGTAELIITLSGDAHHGASVSAEQLKALADLGVSLGIEVFPGASR
jgi:Domain of unknown function (DUF4279)